MLLAARYASSLLHRGELMEWAAAIGSRRAHQMLLVCGQKWWLLDVICDCNLRLPVGVLELLGSQTMAVAH
jgi:hypothetical protein